jgi:hypothetical protein
MHCMVSRKNNRLCCLLAKFHLVFVYIDLQHMVVVTFRLMPIH